MTVKRKSDVMWVLIAMWLWAVAAAGETLPVTKEMLEENAYQVTLQPPCNWDKDLEKVKITAVYADPGEYTDVRSFSILDRGSIFNLPLTPTLMRADGDKLNIALNPNMIPETYNDKYLYHVNVEVGTTKARCKKSFGFGSVTR